MCPPVPHQQPALSTGRLENLRQRPLGPTGHESPSQVQQPPRLRHIAISGNSPRMPTAPPPDGTSHGRPRRGHAGPSKQGKGLAHPPWPSRDHGTPSSRQRQKGWVELPDGQVGEGEGQEVPPPRPPQETNHRSSSRTPPEVRTSRNVPSHWRTMEIKHASKKTSGKYTERGSLWEVG